MRNLVSVVIVIRVSTPPASARNPVHQDGRGAVAERGEGASAAESGISLRIRGSILLLSLTAITAATASAQQPEPVREGGIDGIPSGAVVERLVSLSDPSRSYAVYVPSAYRADSEWPILFLLDPRGRALLPLERFVSVAERFGYVLMSSYDSASDYTGPDPNEPALEAMLADAQELFTLDPRRLYLAGFSGTAQASWALGMRLLGHLAGIIGVGGGMPDAMYRADLSPLRGHPEFGFYGLAGSRDFNYEAMLALEARLDEYGIPNAFSSFPGGHSWPPPEPLAGAVAWMELRAMRSGLRPGDPALVEALYRERTSRAQGLERDGDLLAAYREYRAAVRDFRSMADVEEAQRSVDRLGRSEEVRREIARTEQFSKEFLTAVEAFGEIVRRARSEARAPDPQRIANDLSLDSLTSAATDPTDLLAADAAGRILEHFFVLTSFYMPLQFIDESRIDHALAMLDVAERIFPDRPRICHVRAHALVAAGRRDEAVDAVRCALEAGLPPAVVEEDGRLVPLRDLPEFRALMRRPREAESCVPR